MSQRELARVSGVTHGMISQIEQDRSSPSIALLKRLLDALPVTLADFFGDGGDPAGQVFFRATELKEINPKRVFGASMGTDGTISLRQVGNSTLHRLQMLHERYAPGADTGAELYTHDAEEAGIVISGQIEVTVGVQTEVLSPGDAYLFDSAIPHRFRNLGDEDCVIVSACTPPSF